MWLWICLAVVIVAVVVLVLVALLTFGAVRRFLRTVKSTAAAIPTLPSS